MAVTRAERKAASMVESMVAWKVVRRAVQKGDCLVVQKAVDLVELRVARMADLLVEPRAATRAV